MKAHQHTWFKRCAIALGILSSTACTQQLLLGPNAESMRLVVYEQMDPRNYFKMPTGRDYVLLDTEEELTFETDFLRVMTGIYPTALPVDKKFIAKSSYDYSKVMEGNNRHMNPADIPAAAPILRLDRERGIACLPEGCAHVSVICPPYRMVARVNGLPCKHFGRK